MRRMSRQFLFTTDNLLISMPDRLLTVINVNGQFTKDYSCTFITILYCFPVIMHCRSLCTLIFKLILVIRNIAIFLTSGFKNKVIIFMLCNIKLQNNECPFFTSGNFLNALKLWQTQHGLIWRKWPFLAGYVTYYIYIYIKHDR
uniref:Uncharacterized protein n=1 Tax=Schistocephalus solidus TaxID=70667 RepID=A0A0V0J2D0_SCHSO